MLSYTTHGVFSFFYILDIIFQLYIVIIVLFYYQ